MPAGRPTELDDELYLKIRDLVLEGKTLDIIAKELEIPFKTIESWSSRNYQGFNDRFRMYRQERMLMKAERNIEEIIELETIIPAIGAFGPIIDKKTKKPVMRLSSELLKIKKDTSEFVAETLGKRHYSKRQENTGPDGGPMEMKWVDDNDANNHHPVQTP